VVCYESSDQNPRMLGTEDRYSFSLLRRRPRAHTTRSNLLVRRGFDTVLHVFEPETLMSLERRRKLNV